MKILSFITLCLLLFVGFLPKFGAIDKMAFQWVFLSIVNILLFGYVFFLKRDILSSTGIFRSRIIQSLLLLLLLSIFSIVFAKNNVESLIELSKYFILISSLFSFYIIYSVLKIRSNSVFNLMYLYIILEIIYFYVNLIFFNNSYKGIAANINIEAFSILLKIPFLIHGVFSNYKRILSFILLFLSTSILFLISSRGAFLGLFFILLLNFLFYRKEFKTIFTTIITLIFSFVFSIFYFQPLFSNSDKFFNLSIVNESTNQRLFFYKGAISSFIDSFPFGIGIGNWKVESILYYNEFIQSYIVPYHAHNDFLQIAAEVGVFGLIAYLFFFFFLFRFLIKSVFVKKSFIYIPILCSISIFFLDSNLNFPISRPLIFLQFLFLVSFILYKHKFNPLKVFSFTPIIFILFLTLSGFSSIKVYNSLVSQQYLYTDFSNQKYTTPPEIYNNIDPYYPNLAATTLPIKSFLANYYSNDSIIDKYLNESIIDNPHIKYPQVLKSIRFNVLGKKDSAMYYAKDAFFAIPNNELHAINYLSVLTSHRDSVEINAVFNKYKYSISQNFWNAYFLSLLNLDITTNDSILSSLKEAIDLFPDFPRWKIYELRFTKGEETITRANELFTSAENDFNNADYEPSYNKFLEASDLIPEDSAYLENAGHSLYMMNYNNRALKLFDSVIKYYPNSTGKAHYLKGLMLLETSKNKSEACKLFNIAIKKGNNDALKAQRLICN